MSAFEVNHTHIDVLVSAALKRAPGGTHMYWHHDAGEDAARTLPGETLPEDTDGLRHALREVTRENAGMWGATLAAENRRGVNHRYDEEEWEEPYEFTEYRGRFDPVRILSALACYEYQACEHPEWKTSEAKGFCDALRSRMIRALPGYGDAPWEVTDAAQVTIGEPMPVRRTLRGMR